MIVGIGLDIVDIRRIQKAIEKNSLAGRFFTPAERSFCEGKKVGRYASYAARFAGKEAFVKALGTGFRHGRFQEISIENDVLGCPQVLLSGCYSDIIKTRNIDRIHISLSHSHAWAVAEVILEADV
ncbi:MAG: holo-ACP synthase [Acidaminococcales bacterium]|jgi:holo-[acyl-carrier protein] synthase|nr:holo-ACP synthase [Acidaminococcales bacterium]